LLTSALTDYGWSDALQADFQPFADQGLIPARIVVQQRGGYRLITPDGEIDARATGALMKSAGDSERPTAGDWVAVEARPGETTALVHHVLPLAMPGVLPRPIIGMAHALGETAPLLLIGMIAFIVDVPHGVTEAATVVPVQIFLWSDLPEIGFQAKTSAAIIVLLCFLFLMNGLAITLRKRFERRW
jgi:hypothetical protein